MPGVPKARSGGTARLPGGWGRPRRLMFVGDSSIDMLTAGAIGAYPVGVAWGFRPVRELLDNGAEAILNSPLDIIKLF